MIGKTSRSGRRGMGAGLLALAALTPAGACVAAPLSAAPAHAARTLALNESGSLHLLSKHGFTLNEQGSAAGAVSGPIAVRLTIVSTNQVTANMTLHPSGGSISGHASASYHRGSSEATFSGTMSLTGGGGRYAHARGAGLRFSGTIQRSNNAITVHVSGTASY
ncbi:MAG TPA: hypothetical protein VMG62_03670 [Solirubrobacteraceae bacterium]|nr:hypothetical protein [Solirubrobacteraceae bacterium]